MTPVRNKKYFSEEKIYNGVKITIKNFQKKIPFSPKRIKETILKVLSAEETKQKGQITVCLVTDKRISQLNRKYLSKDSPTDVLAFDLSAPGSNEIFADIVISAETAARNAKVFRTRPIQELHLYLVHGLLHILGYDDHSVKQKQLMRKKEKEYAHS